MDSVHPSGLPWVHRGLWAHPSVLQAVNQDGSAPWGQDLLQWGSLCIRGAGVSLLALMPAASHPPPGLGEEGARDRRKCKSKRAEQRKRGALSQISSSSPGPGLREEVPE